MLRCLEGVATAAVLLPAPKYPTVASFHAAAFLSIWETIVVYFLDEEQQ